MMSTSGFPLNIEIPVVSCDICRSKTFYPPGIWHGQLKKGEIPLVIQLQRVTDENNAHYSPVVFRIAGCVTQEETEATAIKNGWMSVKFRASFKLICPECQLLISECVGLWERQS